MNPFDPRLDADVVDFVDTSIGWRIQMRRNEVGGAYCYTRVRDGYVIRGEAVHECLKDYARYIAEVEEYEARIEDQREHGLLGGQIARRIMQAVGLLHAEGHESLYLFPFIEPRIGVGWCYLMGAQEHGDWPVHDYFRVQNDPTALFGMIGHSHEQPFGNVRDSAEEIARGIARTRPVMLERARTPNPAYRQWYADMLDRAGPETYLVIEDDNAREFGPVLPPAWTAQLCTGTKSVAISLPPGWNKR